MHNEFAAIWRGFSRCLVGLLVFAQIAVAADVCARDRLVGGSASLAIVTETANHFGHSDAHCANRSALAEQASAFEVKRAVPDTESGIGVTRIWVVVPVAGTVRAHFVPPRSGPPLLLQFQKLRL